MNNEWVFLFIPIILLFLMNDFSAGSVAVCVCARTAGQQHQPVAVCHVFRGHTQSSGQQRCALVFVCFSRLFWWFFWVVFGGFCMLRFVLKTHFSTTKNHIFTDFFFDIYQSSGAVALRFCIEQTSFCFVCAHLAAGSDVEVFFLEILDFLFRIFVSLAGERKALFGLRGHLRRIGIWNRRVGVDCFYAYHTIRIPHIQLFPTLNSTFYLHA